MKRIFLLVLCLFLISCTNSHDIEIAGIESIDVTFFYDGQAPSVVNYGKDSVELAMFREWLSNNRNDWESYPATIAIGDFIVKGNGFILHIGHGSAVINFESGNEFRQLLKKVPVSELSFLKNP